MRCHPYYMVFTLVLLISGCSNGPAHSTEITSTLPKPTNLTPNTAQAATRTAPPTATDTAIPSSVPNPTPLGSVSPPPTAGVEFRSDLPITPENAASLVLVEEIEFSPWELVNALTWSPEGGMLAVSAGNRIYIYSSPMFEELASLEVGALTHALVFSTDGALLAAGSRDSILRLWHVSAILSFNDKVSAYLELTAHKKGVNSVAFSPDGRVLATGGNDAVARFWDPISGEHTGSVIGGTFAVPAIAFSPREKTLAVVNGNVVRLRDVETESILGTFQADTSLYSLTYHPDSLYIAAGDIDNRVLLWKPEEAFRSGVEEYPEPLLLEAHYGDTNSYQGLVWQLDFSPDGRMLASAGGDATLRLWELSDLSLIKTLAAHEAAVTCLGFSPDGRLLATGGLDGAFRIWGIATNN